MVENESIRKPIQTLRKTDAITRENLITLKITLSNGHERKICGATAASNYFSRKNDLALSVYTDVISYSWGISENETRGREVIRRWRSEMLAQVF